MDMFLDKLVRLNSQADGRDKIARLIQYACRAAWDSIRYGVRTAELIDRLKTMEFLLSSFRKLLRFGKCIDLLHAARKNIHHRNLTLRLTLTLSKIAQALYLYADHILWLSRSGVVKSINANRWNETANKYWLASIVINLCRDMYELSKLIDQSVGRGASITKRFNEISLKSKNDLQRTSLQIYSYVQSNRAIFIDTTKNLCDLFIPLTSLGYTKLKPRTIGMLGVISSIAGILVLLEPAAKLVPS